MTLGKVFMTGVGIAALIWPAMAGAHKIDEQVTPSDPSAAVGGGDIVVTAQKRTQRLQDVPISASVLGETALHNDAIRSLQDIKLSLPSVAINRGGPTDRLYIRGIGSGDNPDFDQAVATFIDEVYHGRSRGSGAALFDLERTEVLKGPQSTFFGNSAIAGAINITTKKPTDTLSGYAFGSYNFDFNQYVVEGAIGGPIAPDLTGRISFLAGTGDGWIADTTAHEKIPATNDRAIRGQLRWQASDRLRIDLKGEAGRFKQTGGPLLEPFDCPPVIASPTQNGFSGPVNFCVTALANGDDVKVNNVRSFNNGGHADLWTKEAVLAAAYDLGSATLSSTTAYNRYKYYTVFDQDQTSSDLFTAAVPETYNQFSQELRLASSDTGFLNYTVGAYYQRDHLNGQEVINYQFLTKPVGQVFGYNQHESILSGFASITLNLTTKLSVTGGLRAQQVHKNMLKSIYYGVPSDFSDNLPVETAATDAAGQAANLGPVGIWHFSRTDSAWTPSAVAKYKFTPDVMAYASYANGFKAGGFNVLASSALNAATGMQDNVPFKPERVNSFEIGLKSRLFDRRLTLNVSAFHSRYTDLQVGGNIQTTSGPVAVVSNAGSSLSRGIEVEADLRVTHRLQTGLQFSLLDAHYVNFTGASPTSCQQIVGQCVYGSTTPAISRQDLSGKETPYAPKTSGVWNVDYELPINTTFRLALNSQLFFSSHYSISINNDPFIEQPGFVRLQLSARLIDAPGGWEAGLLVRNVNNASVYTFGGGMSRSTGSYAVVRDPPRSFTLQFRKSF
jgi:iron complex outermembrane receptor protein